MQWVKVETWARPGVIPTGTPPASRRFFAALALAALAQIPSQQPDGFIPSEFLGAI
jgi:hypothetical protein